jgi:hypothetical protein
MSALGAFLTTGSAFGISVSGCKAEMKWTNVQGTPSRSRGDGVVVGQFVKGP